MNMINDFDERVWDKFLDFLFPNEKELTRGDVDSDLRRAGIDMRPSIAKLHALIRQTRETQGARTALGSASRSRQAILERLMGIEAPAISAVQEKLTTWIRSRLSGPQQAVYARKLNDAASDEDMLSLLEDLARLDAFRGEVDDGTK